MFFDRIACILVVLFFLSAVGPTTTTNWLCSALAAPVVSVHDQPGEHLATTSQQVEIETDFSKDVFLFVPSPLRMSMPVVSVCCTLLLFVCCVPLLQRWLAPACPRPPPQLLINVLN